MLVNRRPYAGLLFVWVLGVVFDADAEPLRLSGTTDEGKYTVTLSPDGPNVPIGPLHRWVLELSTADGETFVPRQLGIYGGMPGHGHGLPSEPRVTRQLDAGRYLIDGVRFNMAGHWQLAIGVVGPEGADKIVFDFEVRPPPAGEVPTDGDWTAGDLALLRSLLLSAEPPVDPSNRFSGDPRAVSVGAALFFDPRLSAGGDIACASCHKPALKFSDGLKLGVGSKELSRHTPGLLGVAHADWFYWDGRRDSLWAQAVTPLEAEGEMDNDRLAVVRRVLGNSYYAPAYLELTGHRVDVDGLPAHASPFGAEEHRAAWSRLSEPERQNVDRAFSNIGKFIASFIETLQPGESRFDRFAKRVLAGEPEKAGEILNDDEIAGLKLFLDPAKTQCLRCHNGSMFTNHGFHNIGTAVDDAGNVDMGRVIGLSSAEYDPFNCRGHYSDIPAEECKELRFGGGAHEGMGAFKVPSLRNAALTAPYMHDGRFASLEQVVEYYRDPPEAEVTGHELPPLDLTDRESRQLVAFLATLNEVE